jgi:ATP-dependent DNA ligase
MATACSGGVRLLQFWLARRPCCRYLLGTMLWRSTNSPARRPEGFIEPCLPTLGHSVPTGSQWAYEIKHDSFRFICRRDGDRVRVFSRRPAVLA